ncbi:MAG: glycosyltransferase family 4 protein, partial [Acidocella sp.]|nr:glycosyltransferase family 4 protein [Acidocella sp.]
FAARRDICFLANYTHAPNLDAALYFITDILPLLHASLPAIRLILAGPHPGDTLQRHASAHVIITDHIANLADLFDHARLFICPLRAGAGVKGKIISALSHGLPVISTSIGIEGAGLTPGHDVLVADTPSTFADAIIALYQDETEWQRLSANALAYVETTASSNHGGHHLTAILDAAFAQRLSLRL